MQPTPDPGLVPLGQPTPAGHARTESQLLRQKLPLDTGVQHEQDPAQHLPVGHPRPATPTRPTPRLRQQRLNTLPQLVGDDPRRLFTPTHMPVLPAKINNSQDPRSILLALLRPGLWMLPT